MKIKIALLVLVAGLLYFFRLGTFSLYDAAETTYGVFVKEMLQTNDWITMHFNGQVIFDKPPLYFWLSALLSFIFGFHEFSLRFTGAAAGLLTVITTYFLGKKLYNERTGFLSSIILMSVIQFVIQSRMAEIDTLLTLFLTLTFLFSYLGYQNHQKKFYLLAYLTSAFAILTKGPIGFILPAFCIFIFLLFKKDLKRIFEMQIIPGIIILFLIASPWYFAEWYLHGKAFFDFTLGFLFLSRFQTVVSGHPGPWYYYFIMLLLGFALWSHFLPYGIGRTFKNWKNAPELFILSIVLPTFIVFSLAKTKLPNYLLPLYPFLAIIVAKLWDDFFTSDHRPLKRGMIVSQILLIMVVVLLIIGFVLLGNINYPRQYQELIPHLIFLAKILITGSLISIALFSFRAYHLSFAALPITTIVIIFILVTQTLPFIEKYKGTKELAIEVSQVIKDNEKIAAYNIGNRPGVVFYNAKPIIFLKNEKETLDFLIKKRGYCFIHLSNRDKFKGPAKVFGQKGELVVLY